MARDPKPWWREDRQAWFVTIEGGRHNLGPDKKDAFQKFHELMAAKPEAAPKQPDTFTAIEVFDKFLARSQKHIAPRTYDWYRDHIQSLINHAEKKTPKSLVGPIPT